MRPKRTIGDAERRLVLACLHPDRAGDDALLSGKLTEAFQAFSRLIDGKSRR